jgi:pre-mRNA-processing factor 39
MVRKACEPSLSTWKYSLHIPALFIVLSKFIEDVNQY